MKITNQTSLNMVIGYPLDHSQSPLLHNTVYKQLNINAVLLAFACQNIKAIMQTIKTLAVGLTAVTMPFKEDVLKYLDHCSPEVEILRAANTIINRNGELYGYNTDIDGIAYALRDTSVENKHVLVLGAGGAAKAIAYFLQSNKSKIFWMNRTKEKTIQLAKVFGGEIAACEQLNDLPIDIIINATPLGMYPCVNVSPLQNYFFKSHQTVFDLIYNPIDTRLIKQAKKCGANTVSGLEMFVGQGLRQIDLWIDSDKDLDTKAMSAFVKGVIKNELQN